MGSYVIDKTFIIDLFLIFHYSEFKLIILKCNHYYVKQQIQSISKLYFYLL